MRILLMGFKGCDKFCAKLCHLNLGKAVDLSPEAKVIIDLAAFSG
ncbi:hypothetical protein MNBD_GAMMA11-1639 [hydrothermal vent metagenome]|uniref:Uncharacterized protein n=1 Tax=hydrothermal vent metagenome TaxID=652676 RepID=A0A3B0XWN2_9ZZZZ